MLRSDLVRLLVQRRGLDTRHAAKVVEQFFEALTGGLARDGKLEIRGLGSFLVKEYAGYQGRNPKTGAVIEVKPKRGILFREAKQMRERLNPAAAASPGAAEE
jgi:integration host factor subunit beta